METGTPRLDGFDFELLEAQGGNISTEHFGELLSKLQKSGSVNYTSQEGLRTVPNGLDIVYVVLRKGYLCELDENGFPKCTGVMKDGLDYWLAGLGCLRVGNSGERTADLVVSLLPQAQSMGGGRLLVQKLLQYAFNTLSLRRITASILCPVQPHFTVAEKKQTTFRTKQLCWFFEKFGFQFEGVTRGAVKDPIAIQDGKPVWHDVHRMSLLDTDYFEEGRAYILSNTSAMQEGVPRLAATPWDSMVQRQEEEKRDLESWTENPNRKATIVDPYEDEVNEEQSDDETVLGGDDDSDWEIPDDFDGSD